MQTPTKDNTIFELKATIRKPLADNKVQIIILTLEKYNYLHSFYFFYLTKNGRNGANIFIIKPGRISAKSIAPVDI